MRKVRGDVNPADLFTKHMDSRNKLNQLVALFKCQFLEGRAKAAPALRTEGLISTGIDDYDNNDGVNLMNTHDPTVLPHMHDDDDLENLFPRAVPHAPRDVDCEDDEDAEDELKDPLAITTTTKDTHTHNHTCPPHTAHATAPPMLKDIAPLLVLLGLLLGAL